MSSITKPTSNMRLACSEIEVTRSRDRLNVREERILTMIGVGTRSCTFLHCQGVTGKETTAFNAPEQFRCKDTTYARFQLIYTFFFYSNPLSQISHVNLPFLPLSSRNHFPSKWSTLSAATT